MPFGRFLNVGGKREKRLKKIVCPDAAAASTVTVKTLLTEEADDVGLNGTETCVQTLGLAVTGILAEANV